MLFFLESITDSDNDGTEDDVITDEDDDGWESGTSGPSYMENFPDGCSSVSEEEEPDSAPITSDTYILSERSHCIDDPKVQDFDDETFLLENDELAEKFRNRAGSSPSNLVQDSLEDANGYQDKHQNSDERVCDATYIIGSSTQHKPLRDKEPSNVYKKPVSVVQPFISSNAKSVDVASSLEKTSSSSEDYLNIKAFITRLSMNISHASRSGKTCSRSKALKLKRNNIDYAEMNSSPTKRRSISLCKMPGSLFRDEQGSNIDGCQMDSPIKSPCTRERATLSGHRNVLLLQSPVSPEQPSRSSKTLRRRSSQLLTASGGAISRDLKFTEETKMECLKQKSSPKRKSQVWRGTFLKERNIFSLNYSPATKQSSRVSAPETASPHDSSEKLLNCGPETEITRSLIHNNLIPKCNFSSTHQNSVIFQESNGAAIDKLKECKGQVEAKPGAAFKSKQGHKLLCSKDGNIFSSSSHGTLGKAKPLTKKSDFSPTEMRNSRARKVLCKPGVGGRTEKSGEKSVPLLENFADDRDNDGKRNSLSKAVDSGKYHKREISRAFDEFMSTNDCSFGMQPFTSACRKDLVTKEKEQRTSTLCRSSSRGRVKNSISLSGDLQCISSFLGRSPARKRTARESVALDTPDLLPRKQPKRGSSVSICLQQGPTPHFSSHSLHWQEKESTPIKGKELKRLRVEGFSSKDMKLLSPIRRAVARSCDSKLERPSSPCKGLGSCDKSFCFECC